MIKNSHLLRVLFQPKISPPGPAPAPVEKRQLLPESTPVLRILHTSAAPRNACPHFLPATPLGKSYLVTANMYVHAGPLLVKSRQCRYMRASWHCTVHKSCTGPK